MPEYKKETNKIHKITLTSKIIHALWGAKSASVGEKVNMEVLTEFVGNGSDIQIKIEDRHGKLETLTGKVYGNKFVGSLIVSKKAEGDLTFTAKLPKHNLEKKSEPLKVIPVRLISNAKWDKQEANRGDIIKLTADTKNIPDDTEVKISIYEHDHDGAHDFITKFPAKVKANKIEAEWEFKYHEDTDDIPTDEEMEKGGRSYNHPEYFFVVRLGGVEGKSGLLKFKDWIEIELKDMGESPIPDEEYILYLADGTKKQGRLNKMGYAREDNVSPGQFKVGFPNLFLGEECLDKASCVKAVRAATGRNQVIRIEKPILYLQRFYHDDTPVEGAAFEVELENGQIIKGNLNEKGEAQVEDFRSKPLRVRYGPDVRPYHVSDSSPNPEFKETFTPLDSDLLLQKHLGKDT